MKAAVLEKFGGADVIQVRDIPQPPVGSGQVLVQVHAASVNPIDWKMREGLMTARYGSEFPMVLGWDCSGVVSEVGPDVVDYAVGDAIFARSDLGTGRCYAEYAALNTMTIAPKPAALSHEEAAAIPLVGLTAINGLITCADLQANQHVLVIGASGGVGTVAVQIAKNLGATVTGVCSARNMNLVASLGADAVIDYNEQDALAAGQTYDIVYDTVGSRTFTAAQSVLAAGGTYLTLVPVPDIEFFIPGQTEWQPNRGYFVAWTPTAKDLQKLAEWAEEGRLRAVIDSVFQLDDIRAAHKRSETERAVGKIIIKVSD